VTRSAKVTRAALIGVSLAFLGLLLARRSARC